MMSAGLRCQLGFESRESEPVPLLWLGVLIRQLEPDTTAGWSELRLCCTGLCSGSVGGVFLGVSRRQKAYAHLSATRERK